MNNRKNDFIDFFIESNAVCSLTDSTILNASNYLKNFIPESFQ